MVNYIIWGCSTIINHSLFWGSCSHVDSFGRHMRRHGEKGRWLETLKIRPAFKTLALVFLYVFLTVSLLLTLMYRNSETFRATNLSLRWLGDVERMLHLECTNTTYTTKEHNYWRFWFQSMVWYLIYLQWHVFNNPRLAASPLGSKVGGTDWKMEGSGTWSTCGS
jgi:hypothetical protein